MYKEMEQWQPEVKSDTTQGLCKMREKLVRFLGSGIIEKQVIEMEAFEKCSLLDAGTQQQLSQQNSADVLTRSSVKKH